MFPFTYMHFARMVRELEPLKGGRILDFFYDRNKKVGYLELSHRKIYFDLAHPFVSFFVLSSLDVPCKFEKKDIGISGYKIVKTKHLSRDRVLYMLLKRGGRYKAVALELTGKSSYFLVIDEFGKVIRKYPPYRKRKKGGDIGELYEFPSSKGKFDLKKYMPFSLEINEKELFEKFYESRKFYTDGRIVLPLVFEGARECGEYTGCMFSVYRSLRFGSPGFDFVPDLPYYIYYKAATMLKDDLVEVKDGKVIVDGYEIQVPSGDKESAIEYLYMLGRTKRVRGKINSRKGRDNKNSKILSPSGYEVLIGKSARDNNRITFNIAKGNDMFFHVREYPGAHVILKNHGQPVSEEDIRFCAKLAKMHSKARGGPVDVIYTEVKYVRPVPGVPGRVILLKENNVRL